MTAEIDKIHQVMRRNVEWPREKVRRYARYLLETASGVELPDRE